MTATIVVREGKLSKSISGYSEERSSYDDHMHDMFVSY